MGRRVSDRRKREWESGMESGGKSEKKIGGRGRSEEEEDLRENGREGEGDEMKSWADILEREWDDRCKEKLRKT